MKNNFHDVYKLLADSYTGTGGFMTGNYLTKHPREADEKYVLRQKQAYYLNYMRPCVDAHVSPIFKKTAVRDYTGSGAVAWQSFYNDVDFSGGKLPELMKNAATAAKIFGAVFIVMDSEAEGGQVSLQAAENDRMRLPYCYLVSPLAVDEVKTDKFGNITKFVFYEKQDDDEHNPAKRTLTPDGWIAENSKGTKKGTWDLGGVPVVRLSSNADKRPLPPSEFLSIAKTGKAIYNLSSWLGDILQNQTFSILVYPASVQDDLVIGTSNALGFPPESGHQPGFIAPPDSPAVILADNIKRLQEEIYRMAAVVNVTGVRVASSGTAKAWDFAQTNQILADYANRIESAERKVANLFCNFMGVELDYKVRYPSDFNIADVESELANAEIAKGLNFGASFNVEVFKKVLTSYQPELSDDDFDKLINDYKATEATKKADMLTEV